MKNKMIPPNTSIIECCLTKIVERQISIVHIVANALNHLFCKRHSLYWNIAYSITKEWNMCRLGNTYVSGDRLYKNIVNLHHKSLLSSIAGLKDKAVGKTNDNIK